MVVPVGFVCYMSTNSISNLTGPVTTNQPVLHICYDICHTVSTVLRNIKIREHTLT